MKAKVALGNASVMRNGVLSGSSLPSVFVVSWLFLNLLLAPIAFASPQDSSPALSHSLSASPSGLGSWGSVVPVDSLSLPPTLAGSSSGSAESPLLPGFALVVYYLVFVVALAFALRASSFAVAGYFAAASVFLLFSLAVVPSSHAYPQVTMPDGSIATSDPTPTPWVNYSAGMVPIRDETYISHQGSKVVQGSQWTFYNSSNGCLPCDTNFCIVWCHDFEQSSNVRLDTGEYTFFTRAYDGYNPSEVYDIKFYIDRTPPESPEFVSVAGFPFIVSDDGTVYVDGNNFFIEIRAEEEAYVIWDSGQTQMPGSYDPVNPRLTTADNIGPFSLSPDSLTPVTIEVQDLMYHSANSTFSFYWDTQPPVFTRTTPSDGSFTGDPSPTIAAFVSDAGVGIENVSMTVQNPDSTYSAVCSDSSCSGDSGFSWDGSRIVFSGVELNTSGQTPVSVSVESYDAFGRYSSASWSFTIDTSLPYVESFSLDNGLYKQDEDTTYTASNTTSFTIVMNTESWLSDFSVHDSSGNLVENVLSGFSSADNITFVGSLVSPLSDGIYTLDFTGQKVLSDGSLGSIQEFSLQFGIDSSPPDISGFTVREAGSPSSDRTVEYGSPFTLEFSITDGMLNVTHYSISVVEDPNVPDKDFSLEHSEDGLYVSNVTPAEQPVRGLYDYDDGLYILDVTASDELGNSRTITVNFTINDTVSPAIVFVEPENNVTTVPDPVMTINTSEPSQCWVYRDSPSYMESMASSSGGTVHSRQLSSDHLKLPAEGDYTYHVVCNDSSLNENSAESSVVLTWDTTRPGVDTSVTPDPPITALYPLIFLHVSASEDVLCRAQLFFNASESDFPDLSSYSLVESYYNSGSMSPFGSEDFQSSHEQDITKDIEQHDNGNYTYLVICEDLAGWLSDPVYESFLVQDLHTMRVTNLTPSGWLNYSSVTLHVSTSRLATCRYRPSGSDDSSWQELSSSPSYEHSRELSLSDGYYDFIVECSPSDPSYDVVYPEGSTISFGVDTSVGMPVISSIRDSSEVNVDGSVTNENVLSVRGSAESGFSKVVVRVFSSPDLGSPVFENSTPDDYDSSSGYYSLSVSLPASDSVYYIQSVVWDRANNTNSSSVHNVTLDTTPPADLRLWNISDVNYFTSSPVSVYATADEKGNVISALNADSSVIDSAASSVVSSCTDRTGVFMDASAGDSELTVTEQNIFSTSNFVEFSNQILPYFARFDIVSQNENGLYADTITVSPSLLDAVSSSTQAWECNTEYPTGWVNLSLNLKENSVTDVWFSASDASGNEMPLEGPYSFVVDSERPEMQSSSPYDGYVGADNFTNVTVVLADSLSGIDDASVVLFLDGVNHSGSDLDFYGDMYSRTVVLQVPGGISVGSHSASVSFSDVAGNSNVVSWQFEIDTNVTHEPDFSIAGDHPVDGVHYINQTSDLNVSLVYSGDAPKVVHLTYVGLGDTADEVPPDDQPQDYSRTGDYSFVVSLNSSFVSEDVWHRLNVFSFKEISPSLNSSEGKHHFILRFDTVPPEIDLYEMPYANSPSVTVEGSCYDANFDYVLIDGDLLSSVTAQCINNRFSASVNLSAGQGSKTITAVAFDLAGNSNSDSVSVVLDVDAPSMSGIQIDSETHPAESYWYSNSTVLLNWSEPDDANGIAGYSYVLSRDSLEEPDDSVEGLAREASFENTPSGVYYFALRAVDSAGNWGDTVRRKVLVDVSPPEFGSVKVDPAASSTGSVVNVQVSDAHSGVSGVSMQLLYPDGSVLNASVLPATPDPDFDYAFSVTSIPPETEGRFAVSLSASDNSIPSNVALDSSSYVVLDNVAPEISDVSYEDRVAVPYANVSLSTHEPAYCRWSSSNVSYEGMPSQNQFSEGEGSYQHSTTVSLVEGSNSIFISCRDEVGNSAEPVLASIVYDNVPPPLHDISVGGIVYSRDGTNYTASPSVSVSGVSEPEAVIESFIGTTLSQSAVVNNTVNLDVWIEAWQFVDADGNVLSSASMTEDSLITFASRDDGSYTVYSDVPGHESFGVSPGSPVSFAVDSGVYHFNVSFGTHISSYLNVSVLKRDNSFVFDQPLNENRVSLLSLLARDTVGNENLDYHYSSGFAFSLFADLFDPLVTSVSPENVTVNTLTPLIEAYLNDQGGSGVDSGRSVLFINGLEAGSDIPGSVSSSDSHFSFQPSVPLIEGDVGMVNLSLEVYDNVGRHSLKNWSFTINMLAPGQPVFSLESSIEENGVTYTAVKSQMASLVFDEPVSITYLALNGRQIVIPSSYDGGYSFNFTIDASEGDNVLSVRAVPTTRDPVEGSYSFAFTLDTQPPSISLLSVDAVSKNVSLVDADSNYYLSNDDVVLTFSVSDSNPDSVVLSGNASSVLEEQDSSPMTFEITALLDDYEGNHSLVITARDVVDNSASLSLTVELDTLPPEYLVVYQPRTPTYEDSSVFEGVAGPGSESVVLRSLGDFGLNDEKTLSRSDLSHGSSVTYQSSVGAEPASEGSTEFYVDGYYQCDAGEFDSGWVQFGDDLERYEISGCDPIVAVAGAGFMTRVHVSRPLSSTYPVGTPVYNYNSSTPDGSFSESLMISQGQNVLEAYAYDRIGNYIYKFVSVVKDDNPDLYTVAVSITSPAESETQTPFTDGSITLRASTSEPANSCTATEQFSGSSVLMSPANSAGGSENAGGASSAGGAGGGSTDFYLDLNLSDGDYNYSVVCDPVDDFKWSGSDHRFISVDSTPPDLSVDEISHTPSRDIIITGSCSDAHPGNVSAQELSSSGSPVGQPSSAPCDSQFEIPLTLSEQQGEKTVLVWSDDSAGNRNSQTLTITYDSEGPSVTRLWKTVIYANSSSVPVDVVGLADDSPVTASAYNENSELLGSFFSNYNDSSCRSEQIDSGSKGDTVVNVPDASRFSPGEFVHFETDMPLYASGLLRYEIVRSEANGVHPDYIVVGEPLLEDVSSSATVCSDSHPEGWFSIPVVVSQDTSVWVQAVDEYGNAGPLSEEIRVVYDDVPPKAVEKNPAAGSVTATHISSIKVKVSDSKSPVYLDSVSFVFDGVSYSCSDDSLDCQADSDSLEIPLVFHSGELGEGVYDVSVSARDYAGNVLYDSWQFEINDNVTHQPAFSVVSAVASFAADDGHLFYVDSLSPVFAADYVNDSGYYVNLTFVGIGQENDAYGDSTKTSWERIDNNTFSISFADGFFTNYNQMPTYRLNVYSNKLLSSGLSPEEWSATGYHDILIRVDTLDPVLTYDGPYSSNEWENVVLTGTYQDTNIDRIEITGSGVRPKTVSADELTSSDSPVRFEIPVNLTDPFTDGLKEVVITAYDILGHSSSLTEHINYDRTPPGAPSVSSTTHPEGQTSNLKDAEFSWSAEDSSGIAGYSFELDGQPNTLPPESVGTTDNSTTFENLNDGTWYFHIRALDNAGNWGPAYHYKFSVDSGLPHFTIESIDKKYTNHDFRVSFNASEELSSVSVEVASVQCVQDSYDAGNFRYVFYCDVSSVPGQEWHYITISGTDLVGNYNSETDSDNPVFIDTVRPSITWVQTDTPTTANNAHVNVSTDENATCRYHDQQASYWFMPQSNEMSSNDSLTHSATIVLDEGENYYYISCVDLAGNELVQPEEVVLVKDTTPPPLSNLSWDPLVNVGGTWYIPSSTVSVSGLSEQKANVSLYVNDVVDSSEVIDDSASPVISLGVGTFDPSGPLEVPEGTVLVFSNSADVSRSMVSDYPGQESFSVPAGGTYSILLTELGTYHFQMSIGGEPFGDVFVVSVRKQSDAFELSSSELASYNLLYVIASDQLGNRNESEQILAFRDDQPPVFSNPSPEFTTDNRSTRISIDVHDETAGLDDGSISMTVAADATYHCTGVNEDSYCDRPGASLSMSGSTVSFVSQTPLTSSSRKDVNVEVSASDMLGNAASYNWTFTIDTETLPEPEITVEGEIYDDGSYYTSSVHPLITINFSEEADIISAEFDNTSVSPDSFITSDNKIFTLPTEDLLSPDSSDDSLHVFTLSAVKPGLNTAGTWSKSFTRDTIWPVVEINDSETPSTVGSSPVRVKGTCYDSNLASLTVGGIATTCSDNSFFVDVPVSPGENLIVAEAADIVGHSSRDNITVTYDDTPPSFIDTDSLITPTALKTQTLRGVVDPGAAYVNVTVWNASGLVNSYAVLSWTGPSVQLAESVLEEPVSEGSAQIIIDRHLCSADGFGVGRYVQFDNDYFKRYEVSDCTEHTNFLTYGYYSIVTLEEPVSESHSGSVKSFDTLHPEGYFEVNVTLAEGENLVDARAYDEVGLYADDNQTVVYDPTLKLDMSLVYPDSVYSYEPLQYSVSASEYDNRSGIPVTVSTSEDASCTISHSLDDVAFDFVQPMQTSDGKTHTFMIDQNSCGSTHCLVMGNGSWVWHNYIISCSAPKLGLNNTLNLTFVAANVYDRETTGDYVCGEQQRLACSAGTIQGIVTAPDGSPVQDALVSSSGISDRTDASGSYSLSPVPSGTASVEASRSGFVTYRGSVNVPARAAVQHDIVLEPYAGLYGTVFNSLTAERISGAVVTANGLSQNVDASGNYDFSKLSSGEIVVSADAPGYSVQESTLTLESGERVQHDFYLVPQGAVKGRVLDASDGSPVPDAHVYISDKEATTGSDGIYYVENIDAGNRTVTIKKTGFHDWSSPVEVLPGSTSTVDASLTPKGRGNIRGTVMDEFGNPVSGAIVSVPQDEAIVSSYTTNSSGGYLLEGVFEGLQVVSVEANGFMPKSSSVDVSADSDALLDFYLLKPGSVAGYVMLMGSNDYSQLSVTASCGAALVDRQTGRYSVHDAPPGPCTVTASSPGYSSSSSETTVPSGEEAELNLVLQPESGPIISGGWQ